MSEPLIEVKNLKKYFPIRGGILQRTIGYVKAVDGVTFTIKLTEKFFTNLFLFTVSKKASLEN